MSATTVPASSGLTRREFLFYIWGASMALFTAEFAGLFVWFALPRFKAGEFGGVFEVPIDSLPTTNDEPAGFSEGRFWLVNLDTSQANNKMYRASDENQDIVGVAAVYKVCTHLGCIYAWNKANERFECPCHGSKYRLDGRRVEDPAPRTLDRFEIQAVDVNGTILATAEKDADTGSYLPLVLPANTAEIWVNTGVKARGASLPLISEIGRAS
ncbi:MAG: ubiquinol-cytochrome c reductase iron-sulfur subunit [Chloroflexi bacterium]|nr:ubiquinol-cytochrome c reductase iron-sulfur subunit [Chloroflexota bacterium]MBP8057768.1 ubiquinol-cytochrome c reductase iron-sulfur subunit [Chloroflexota bacterium]